jgi:hypothetical protein
MGIVGCTAITKGTAKPNSSLAPAYRSSVSMSVSASSVTSSMRESQRQQSLTKQAVVNACNTFASSANEAVDKMNVYTATVNRGGNTAPVEGPARDALNNSATVTTDSINDRLSQELRDALNAYADAARNVAKLVGPNPPQAQFNAAVRTFNERMAEVKRICRASA